MLGNISNVKEKDLVINESEPDLFSPAKPQNKNFFSKFQDYHNLFENCTTKSLFNTKGMPVVKVVLTKPGDRALAIVEDTDEKF